MSYYKCGATTTGWFRQKYEASTTRPAFADDTRQKKYGLDSSVVLDSKAQIHNDLIVHNVSRVEIKGTKIK